MKYCTCVGSTAEYLVRYMAQVSSELGKEWEREEIGLISDLQQLAWGEATSREFQQIELEERVGNGHLLDAAHTPWAVAASPARAVTSPLRRRQGKRAPEKMRRGAATVCGDTAYFNSCGSHKVYVYRTAPEGDRWFRTPAYPHKFFSLAVVNGQVTGVGGMNDGLFSSKLTGALLSLTGDGIRKKWCEIYTPMPTPRAFSSAIATDNLLVVAGGGSKEVKVDAVEVMNIITQQWTTASPLPRPLTSISGAVYGDRIFLGGFFCATSPYTFSPSQSVLTCSLSSLAASPVLQARQQNDVAASQTSPWKALHKLPVICSTLTTFNGNLVAVGGEIFGKYSAKVYRYDPHTDSWLASGEVENERSLCLAAVVPGNQLVVVGGLNTDWWDDLRRIDSVEILTPP